MLSPKVCGGNPGGSFSVNVLIADVTSLYAWQFNLTFNPAVLGAVNVVEGPFLKQAGTTLMPTTYVNNTAGWVFAGSALLNWDEGGASGSGVLATVNFNVKIAGTCSLGFSVDDTWLRGYDGEVPVPMESEVVEGVFAYPRDLAVTGLVVSSSSVSAGESVSVTATVLNKGIVDDIFNVTLYRNSTVIETKVDVAVDSGDSGSVVFSWDTSGVPAGRYVLKAEVIPVSGENDTTNNVFVGETAVAVAGGFIIPIEYVIAIAAVIVIVVVVAVFYLRRRSKKT
jgi:general secretion pathway protein D